jgi:hypothetical protein
MAASTLYRRLLGSQFDELPEVLRRFHDAPGGGRARGTFQVARGRGWMQNALAFLLRLPAAGRDLAVELHVAVEGQTERWTRCFPDRRLVSVQSADRDLLMERFGLAAFSTKLVIAGPCVRYEFRRAWLAGIPLPRRLAPVVNGWVVAGDSGWQVVVHLLIPFVGEILHYDGWVQPA